MKWLSRELITGPRLMLALSERDYMRGHKEIAGAHAAAKAWIVGGDATTHMYAHATYGLSCIVCLRDPGDIDSIQIASLLVHEAVHVFQFWCKEMGEHAPSDEFQAYAIQAISRQLMESYAHQKAIKKRK